MKTFIEKYQTLILAGVVLIALWYMNLPKDRWLPILYLNASDTTNYLQGPEMRTMGECMAWNRNTAAAFGRTYGEYDSECGWNCEFNQDYGINVCKDTF